MEQYFINSTSTYTLLQLAKLYSKPSILRTFKSDSTMTNIKINKRIKI